QARARHAGHHRAPGSGCRGNREARRHPHRRYRGRRALPARRRSGVERHEPRPQPLRRRPRRAAHRRSLANLGNEQTTAGKRLMNEEIENTRICVVGLGYIGLPTASLLATKGYRPHGVDVSERVVATINEGRIHIREPELDVLVKSAVQSGRLKAALEPAAAEVFILAVPTPFKGEHEPDLNYVEAATRSIAPHIKAG